MKTGGIVLCGGESRRMGVSKAWLRFGEQTMLQRVVGVLLEVLNPVVVVAAPGQALPDLPPELCVVRDTLPGRGPLQGLATGLAALPEEVERAYVSGCDTPLLMPDFVRFLLSFASEGKIVAPQDGDRFHPLAAVYNRAVLPEVQKMLDADCLKLMLLLERGRVRPVPVEDIRAVDPELRSLRNINSPEDYRTALEMAGVEPEA